MTRVWLVRHGASTASPGVAIGVSDPPLADLRRAQARSVAAALAARPLVRVISSDLQRALETATIIAARHQIVVETSAALREVDFGTWEGRDVSDLERRVAAFWRRTSPLPGTGEIAIVGHGGSLAALRALISGEPIASTIASRLELGAVIGLDAG